ncbi:MAG: sigma-E factor negative regulatory protein [Pseudomonadales bacterium]
MTEQLRQSLSAVVDSEADAFELRRVLDELERDPALRASWMRYHLIGSVIRGEHQALEGQTADRLGRPLRVEPHTTLMPLTMAAASPVDDGRGPVDRRTRARHSDANSDARADLRRWPGFRGRAAPISAVTALAGVFALASAALFTGAGTGTEATDTASVQVAPPVAVPPSWFSHTLSPDDPVSLPVDEQWVQAYMLRHAQQQGLDQRGVISLVRPATYSVP